MQPLERIPLGKIRAARERIQHVITRTPLIPLNLETAAKIHLKLENLQPIGSFKLRGAANVMLRHREAIEAKGVYTASAGNMGQGVAWMAREMGVPCHVVVPDHAPKTKLRRLDELGATVLPVPFDDWWRVLETHLFPGIDATFVHPVSDIDVIAGNATVGLELLEDLPDVDTVLVPFGGGGLSCGIASAMRALRPQVRTYACEVETAAPLATSLERGEPVRVEYQPSFVDGIGGRSVLREMWPLARHILAGSLVASIDDVAAAVRALVERNRVIAEGAGATPVAVALSGEAGSGKIICVVSGGNIDNDKLERILRGETP